MSEQNTNRQIVKSCNTCTHAMKSESKEPCKSCNNQYSHWESLEAYLRSRKEAREGMTPGALSKQVGGSHYKDFAIQPITFIHANRLDFIRGNIIKYACRAKDGAQDIRKIIHYAELLLELEYGEKP